MCIRDSNDIGGFDFNHGGGDKPLLYLKSNHFQYWDATSAQDDGQWHHWAVVVDIDSMAGCKLYVDGVLQNQSTSAQSVATAYGNLEIGRSSTSTEYDGYLCNFGVWSGHLTQPEIKSIMNKNYAKLTDNEKENLVSWWNLDSSYIVGDVTHKTADSHGSNHGTLS